MTWKHVEVIEDPIISVALYENQQALEKETSRPRRAASRPSATLTATQDSQKINSESVPESHHQDSSLASGSEYSPGNVSIKPKVMRAFTVTYPEQAKKARVEGAVRLSVLVDSEGLVKDVSVLEGPGFGLNEAAQEALKKFSFSPAEKEGEKVAVRIVYVYRFRLESR